MKYDIRLPLIGAALVSVACLAADTPPAVASPSASVEGPCFRSGQFQSWRAPDEKTIYVRVEHNRFYRLNLAAKCPTLLWPQAHLTTHFDGSMMVCTPLDWNIRVSVPPGAGEGCIVKSMALLSPPEVAAIPAEFKP